MLQEFFLVHHVGAIDLFQSELDEDTEFDLYDLMQQLPIDDRLTTTEFVNINDHMPTTAIPTPEEILTSLREPEDDDEELPMKISLSEAKVLLKNLALFLANPPDGFVLEKGM
ncbi:3153_t:CDS:2 [Ambispora gerdemannii]|uniref:3153_t:CDS:1 n=1 Tax=Ambispora gerdemannii TaxID=144530 RepID=A0A9N9G2M0_9GLOM|nr:3153_t:CDS:2 [Ambispora gerdemannii]